MNKAINKIETVEDMLIGAFNEDNLEILNVPKD